MLKDFFSNNGTIGLEEISFKAHDNKNIKSVPCCVEDRITSISHTDTAIKVVMTRKISLGENEFFDLEASFHTIHFLKEEYNKSFQWDDYDLNTEVNNEIDFFVGPGFDRLSLVLSQITSSFGGAPIVTPPMHMKKMAGG